jgi:rhodanese-related sulfurtransferase
MHKLFALTLAVSAVAVALAQDTSQSQHSGAGFQTLVQDAKTRISEMNVDQLKAAKASGEKFTLIDVREDNEWAAGHASGAVHMSKGVIERDVEAKVPDKKTKLVLYCGSGARSALAADSLMKMGYSNVFSLAGGINGYQAAGLPVEK